MRTSANFRIGCIIVRERLVIRDRSRFDFNEYRLGRVSELDCRLGVSSRRVELVGEVRAVTQTTRCV